MQRVHIDITQSRKLATKQDALDLIAIIGRSRFCNSDVNTVLFYQDSDSELLIRKEGKNHDA